MTKNNFDKIFKGTNKIFFVSYRAYHITHNLHFPENNEIAKIIRESTFLGFSKYTYYYMLTIELYKLFIENSNNKCSFYELLKKLDKIKHKVLIEFIEDQLQNEVTSETKNKLKKLRSKIYAHTDIDENDIASRYSLSWNELEQLIDTGSNILTRIYNDIYNTSYIIPPLEKFHMQRFLNNHNKFMKDSNELLKITFFNNKKNI